ncbi:MAG TPA: class I SAM-dependent methyltransferase [Vicinamibacterales bacterium]|nr:class I SAM-dependent methyltransferase [Vicinamibacterales bacterium]
MHSPEQGSARRLTPTLDDLRRLFVQKHGEPSRVGWGPRRRYAADYYTPADVYEATVDQMLQPGDAWVDVGGGHNIFPENPRLAATLVARSKRMVAIDPDPAVHEHALAGERHQCLLEDYRGEGGFDLATLRMVVEHVDDPLRFVRALHGLLAPRGYVVVLTVDRWSPISVAASVVPFSWHHRTKRLFWGGDERDTFPVRYKMNTRRALRASFVGHGFEELTFVRLDDLSAFGRFRALGAAELGVWRVFRALRLRYPESCFLGIYRRLD